MLFVVSKILSLHFKNLKTICKVQKNMIKITFMGAGSTVFARNVLGDCMCTDVLRDSEIALYDIDATRLEESFIILSAMICPV